tara:strand:+ start:629 stop:742 length:114 start_codon:yes stop_codon:yes gene_type:complete
MYLLNKILLNDYQNSSNVIDLNSSQAPIKLLPNRMNG